MPTFLERSLPVAVTIAGALLITRSVASLPLLGFFFATLTLGALLGVGILAATASYAFHQLTRPPSPPAPTLNDHIPSAPPAAGEGSAPIRRRYHLPPGTARDVNAPQHSPPHAFTSHGRYLGVVYTSLLSQWSREGVVEDWPPRGPAFHAWHAEVIGGTLVLESHPHKHHPVSKNDGHSGSGSTQKAAGDASEHQPNSEGGEHRKVGIPLDGCIVEIVTECLKGRSDTNRRCPLVIRHPKWNLLDGEPGFYLFATDPGAKQQWYHALRYWSEGGHILQQLEQQYQSYCRTMSERVLVPFAREPPPKSTPSQNNATAPLGGAGGTWAGTSGSTSHPTGPREVTVSLSHVGGEDGGGKGKWKQQLGAKLQTARRQYQTWKAQGLSATSEGGSSALSRVQVSKFGNVSVALAPVTAARASAPPSVPSVPSSPAAPNAIAPLAQSTSAASTPTEPAVLDIDSIIEARWMQSRKVPVPPVPAKSAADKRGKTPQSSIPSSPGGPSPIGSPIKAPPPDAAAARGVSSGTTTPAAPSSPVKPPLAGPSPRPPAAGTTAPPPLPPPTSMESPSAPGSPPPPSAAAGQGVNVSSDTHADGYLPSQFQLPFTLPAPVSIDHCINMALTRVCFDLSRSPAFEEYMRTRIQRNLSRLQTPDYVQSLQVVGLDPGDCAPSVRNIRALPSSDATVWPQLLFDVKYQGAYKITISCKVDIRDAPAWGALDRALERIEGKPGITPAPSEDLSEDAEGWDTIKPGENDEDEGAEGPEGGLEEEGQGTSSGDSPKSPSTDQEAKGSTATGGRALISTLRQTTAKRLRKLAETTAVHISRMNLKIDLTFKLLEGTVCAWIPPPPGDRIFYSFVTAPKLVVQAKPQIAGRLLKYTYHASRASQWIEARMALAFTKNMVFPAGGDIVLPLLFSADHPFLDAALRQGGGSVPLVVVGGRDGNENENGNESGEAPQQNGPINNTAMTKEANEEHLEAGQQRGSQLNGATQGNGTDDQGATAGGNGGAGASAAGEPASSSVDKPFLQLQIGRVAKNEQQNQD